MCFITAFLFFYQLWCPSPLTHEKNEQNSFQNQPVFPYVFKTSLVQLPSEDVPKKTYSCPMLLKSITNVI